MTSTLPTTAAYQATRPSDSPSRRRPPRGRGRRGRGGPGSARGHRTDGARPPWRGRGATHSIGARPVVLGRAPGATPPTPGRPMAGLRPRGPSARLAPERARALWRLRRRLHRLDVGAQPQAARARDAGLDPTLRLRAKEVVGLRRLLERHVGPGRAAGAGRPRRGRGARPDRRRAHLPGQTSARVPARV